MSICYFVIIKTFFFCLFSGNLIKKLKGYECGRLVSFLARGVTPGVNRGFCFFSYTDTWVHCSQIFQNLSIITEFYCDTIAVKGKIFKRVILYGTL